MKYFWIILLAETISAQVPYFGSCPQLSVKDNFLLTNYSGVWYEAEKYPNTYDYFGRCVTQAIYQDEWNNWRIFNQQIIVVFFIILAIAFDYGATQVPFLKRCPKVSVQPNFQLDQYLGIWYEVEKYPTIFELGGKCITANYTRDWNGIVRVRNSQKMIITGKPVSIQGTASQVDGAKLQVSLEVIPGFSPSSPYWILSTDYDNYAVVWSCTDFLFASQRFLWILTRHPHPPVPVMEEVYRVLDYFQIEKSCLTRTDQNGCY